MQVRLTLKTIADFRIRISDFAGVAILRLSPFQSEI